MTQLSSSLLPTDDTGNLTSGTSIDRAFFTTWLDAINTLVHSATNPTITPEDITDEVVAARDGQASLDARLDAIVALIGASGDAVDIPATYGENVSAGDSIYMSAGLGGKTAGRWYKTDADDTYASSAAVLVGFAPNAVLAGASDFARIAGRITLSGLTAGTTYYASATAGGVTSVAPANVRPVGIAMSTTILAFPVNVPDASATIPGLVSLGAQTWTGLKTGQFAGTVAFSALPTGVGGQQFSRVTANVTKNNNNTYGDVTGLSFVVEANASYVFEFTLHFQTTAVADLKITLTGPAAPTALRFGATDINTTTSQSAFGSDLSINGSGANCMLKVAGLLRNGANAGTVQLQMAQINLEATNTVVYAESCVVATRVA